METYTRDAGGNRSLKVEIASTPRASPIHTVIKDVTLVAGIKDWTGDSRRRTVHEFFAQIDTYAKVSNWAEDEKALITGDSRGRTVHEFFAQIDTQK